MLIPKLPFNIPQLPSLPTLEISPFPELIFLRTVKGLLSFVINLSLLDLSLILIIISLVNVNPPIRQKAALCLSSLLLLFGVEVSAVNVYALVRLLTHSGRGDVNTYMTNSMSCAPGSPHLPLSNPLQLLLWGYSMALHLL
jgi:hypothetical protein